MTGSSKLAETGTIELTDEEADFIRNKVSPKLKRDIAALPAAFAAVNAWVAQQEFASKDEEDIAMTIALDEVNRILGGKRMWEAQLWYADGLKFRPWENGKKQKR